MTGPRILEALVEDRDAERRALVAGICASPASIPPKYFYDAIGCVLYAAICELPEYYPTRTERAILAEQRDAIACSIGQRTQFVDLGAGDCGKARPWLSLLAPVRYVAVDYAGDALRRSLARIAADFPATEVLGIVTDFAPGLDINDHLGPGAVTFFYPGSSIGNFAPDEARALLRDIRRHCIGRPASGLLIGVDTKKDKARLDAAYDDVLGVTAAFNRNVLRRVNRTLGSDFAPEAWAHLGFYNADAGRVEMHLEARTRQQVRLPGTNRTFAAGERIHTENSYKYAPAEFAGLLADAGFGRLRCWQDGAGDFAVFYAA